MVKFVLQDRVHRVEGADPGMTVLDYLRERLARTGTKEGCAAGDCGACTVVVASLAHPETDGAEPGLRYHAINSCITPLGSLQGKQLITVEDLQQGDALHPVQQCMVDQHGSQCGFCTPGFVMSMFAHRKTAQSADRNAICDALGGNLCRCTGYRPIIDAATAMFEGSTQDQFTHTEPHTLALLAQLTIDEPENTPGYDQPASVDQLAAILEQNPQATLVAGGTDLYLQVTQSLQRFDHLVDISDVAELSTVRQEGDILDIGAAAPYSDIRAPLVANFPSLGELLDRLGSLQIRNRGTIGGNIANASPIADMPPALIALGATMRLRCGENTRDVMLEDFYTAYRRTILQPGEFIERIRIPLLAAEESLWTYKLSKRWEDDISATCAAIYLRLEDGIVADTRIAFGGMAEIPRRAPASENALIGTSWNEANVRIAAEKLTEDFHPISDFRASADYRLSASQNLLLRCYLESSNAGTPIRMHLHA